MFRSISLPASSLFLLVLLFPIAADALLDDLFLGLYFLIGAVFRGFAEPYCEAGIEALLGVSSDEDVDCSCLAAFDEQGDDSFLFVFPNPQGAASCRSRETFCLDEANGRYCGRAAVGETFRKDGSFARTDNPLYSYFNVEFGSETPFEIRIEAAKKSETAGTTALTTCRAFVDSVQECESCDICDDDDAEDGGRSFTANCDTVRVGGSSQQLGPNLLDRCRNFAFRPVA